MLHEQTERQRLRHHGSMCGAAALTPAVAVARQDVQEILRHKIEQKKKEAKQRGEKKRRTQVSLRPTHCELAGWVLRFPRHPRVQPLA